MTRHSLIILLSCVQLLGSATVQPANACFTRRPPAPVDGVRCGNVRSNWHATHEICVNALNDPDGKPAPAAVLYGVPETYPWLFSFATGAEVPWQEIKVTNTVDGFSTLRLINGWTRDDTAGAEESQFQKFSRVKDVLIETASGHSIRRTLRDSEEAQHISLPGSAAKEWVRLKVLSIYPGRSAIVALRSFSIAWEADQ